MIPETVFAQLYVLFYLTLLVAAFGLIAVIAVDHGRRRPARQPARLGQPATQP